MPLTYQPLTEIRFLGRSFHCLDLSRELSPDIPIYPGHAKVAFWTHLSYEEASMRTNGGFAYLVKGMTLPDHASTHIDAMSHMSETLADMTVEKLPLELFFTEGAWIDLSDVAPRTHITLEMVKRAMAKASLEALPEGGSLLYYTGAAKNWDNHLVYNTQYPGLDEAASRWILDQGVVNLLTDAVSTDNPADLSYPNHHVHAEYLISHTEVVNNINRIPKHAGFWVVMLPLRLTGLSASPVRIVALWE